MYLMEHGPQPPDGERRYMAGDVADQVKNTISQGSLVANKQRFVELVEDNFSDPVRLDGWNCAYELTASLGHPNDELFWSDLDLARPCLGIEHAAAVFQGNENDYAPYFYDAPEALETTRLTALLQDSGKALAVAEDGNNFGQTAQNVKVTRCILDATDATEPHVKQAVLALVGQDIIGGLLQGRDVAAGLEAFQQAWPAELADYRDDLLLASYLSDASAHSGQRLYQNARNSYTEPAVRTDDMNLDFLFTRHSSGAVTLTPGRCELLLQALPGVKRLRPLLTGEPSPVIAEGVVFEETVKHTMTSEPRAKEGSISYNEDGNVRTLTTLGTHALIGNFAQQVTIETGDDGYDPLDELRNDHVAHQVTYYAPGDGRVWGMGAALHSPTDYYQGYIPAGHHDNHPNRVIDSMLATIVSTRAIERNRLGQPLPSRIAWKLILDIKDI